MYAIRSYYGNDKAKTYQFVSNTGIKMPDTRFIKHNFADTIMDEYNNTKENFVIKSIDGHGGSSVFLYNELNKQKIVQSINSSDMVVQPLIGTKHKDVRVYVIGDQIIAAILRTGKDDFRSNYSVITSYSIHYTKLYETTGGQHEFF